MSNIKLLAACTVSVFAAACAKEVAPSTNPGEEGVVYEEIAVSGSTVSKTVMVTDNLESNKVNWCQGDAISAFSTNVAGAGNCKLSSDNTGQVHETTFKGYIEDGTTGVVVLYPYNASATFSQSDKVLNTTIPTEQTATVSSFENGAAITVGQGPKLSREVSLEFRHLCSVLEFTVPVGINASQIKIESINPEVKMTGAVTVDCSTIGAETIKSATNNYVILNGTFESEKSYCVTVAPGNYDKGFKFSIKTAGGNTYYRVAMPLQTVSGGLYKLGTPSYEFDESNVTVEAAIVPTYDNMAVTGSTATLTVTTNLPPEFKDLVTGWTLQNIVFSQNGEEFRKTASTEFTSGTAVEIAATAGHPYMPHSVGEGKYDYTADICYKVNGKDHKLTVTGTATAPALDPDKFEIKFNFAGYTSLSVAKGYDGQTKDIARANSLDNSTVWGVGEKTYQSGLSSDVYSQCADPLLVYSATKYDNNTVSGTDVTYSNQSWAAHTISCEASFDGVSPTKQPSKSAHVTGLPFYNKPPKNTGAHPWYVGNDSKGRTCGDITWGDERVEMKRKMDGIEMEPRIVSPYFHIPENVDVSAYWNVARNKASVGSWPFEIILVWRTQHTNDNSKTQKKSLGSEDTYSSTWNTAMDVDHYRWDLTYDYALLNSAVTYVYEFNVTYR